MIKIINKIRQDFDSRLEPVSDLKQLEQIRIGFLGKKGQLQGLMKELRHASPEEKPKLGKDINLLKQHIENKLNSRSACIGSKPSKKLHEIFEQFLEFS